MEGGKKKEERGERREERGERREERGEREGRKEGDGNGLLVKK